MMTMTTMTTTIGPKNLRSRPALRRLNGIAMAPPQLKRFPRGVKMKHNFAAARKPRRVQVQGCFRWLNALMEAERESAIKRYREMKERRTREADRTLLTV
jgi:hypothetical protein